MERMTVRPRCPRWLEADAWELDTSWANGVVFVIHGIIVSGGAPIFRKLIGQRLADVAKRGGYTAILIYRIPRPRANENPKLD